MTLHLHEGDRLNSSEFLRRWEAMPDLKRAELIDGVVFFDSPGTLDYGTTLLHMGGCLSVYESRTRGCQAGMHATWVMGPKDTPQPDVFLRILPEWGGQSKNAGNYGGGAPELIVEVSGSSLSRDFGIKLELYQRTGVREYLTVQLNPRLIVWRQLTRGRYRELKADDDGILRSRIFPGLWLDPEAVWDGDLLTAVERGIASPEHAAFVKRLAKRAV